MDHHKHDNDPIERSTVFPDSTTSWNFHFQLDAIDSRETVWESSEQYILTLYWDHDFTLSLWFDRSDRFPTGIKIERKHRTLFSGDLVNYHIG